MAYGPGTSSAATAGAATYSCDAYRLHRTVQSRAPGGRYHLIAGYEPERLLGCQRYLSVTPREANNQEEATLPITHPMPMAANKRHPCPAPVIRV